MSSVNTVEFDIRGLPEVQSLLDQVQGGPLNNRMRRALRAAGGTFRTALRDAARSRSDLPRTMAKTRTRAHRNPLGVSVSPASPLSPIFEHGADPHAIGGAGQLLADTESGFVARGPVSHPGMAARPIIGPVFEETRDAAETDFTHELFEGLDL